MGIFNDMLSSVLSHAPAVPVIPSPASASTTVTKIDSTTARAPGNAQASPPQSSAPAAEVDVAAVLDGLAKKNPEKLDWKKSIVDLMKLLGMDSGLGARKELAKELGYTGDTGDSAKMNVWLHKEVLKQFAANGGKVPESLLG